MLTLTSLSGESTELPYIPDMPAWEYLRFIIAPAAGFRIVDNHTVEERVMGPLNLMFSFENRLKPLKDFANDGGELYYMLPLGPSAGIFQGNASGSGGGNTDCPICLDNTTDFALSCLHRGHVGCFKLIHGPDRKCPLCRTSFTQEDNDRLFPSQGPDSLPPGYVAVDMNGHTTGNLPVNEPVAQVPTTRERPRYYHEPTQRMLGMLEERYEVEMDPEQEDEYYGRAFDEYRIFVSVNGVIYFRFSQYNVHSFVDVSFEEEEYRFTNDVNVFEQFLEGRMREIAGHGVAFDAVAVWNEMF